MICYATNRWFVTRDMLCNKPSQKKFNFSLAFKMGCFAQWGTVRWFWCVWWRWWCLTREDAFRGSIARNGGNDCEREHIIVATIGFTSWWNFRNFLQCLNFFWADLLLDPFCSVTFYWRMPWAHSWPQVRLAALIGGFPYGTQHIRDWVVRHPHMLVVISAEGDVLTLQSQWCGWVEGLSWIGR
jgi:hypothetical protein